MVRAAVDCTRRGKRKAASDREGWREPQVGDKQTMAKQGNAQQASTADGNKKGTYAEGLDDVSVVDVKDGHGVDLESLDVGEVAALAVAAQRRHAVVVVGVELGERVLENGNAAPRQRQENAKAGKRKGQGKAGQVARTKR